MPDLKHCKECGKDKPLEDFPKASRRFDGRETICRECTKEQRARKKYWYPILLKENPRCRICNIHQDDYHKALAVDHCRKTGKVRGLLCDNHNHGIGKFQEDPWLMFKGILYIFYGRLFGKEDKRG